jgi:hypothetical protein
VGRRLVALAAGVSFTHLALDLTVRVTATRDEARTLAACYAEMRTGALDLQSDGGRAALGLALLRLGDESTAARVAKEGARPAPYEHKNMAIMWCLEIYESRELKGFAKKAR